VKKLEMESSKSIDIGFEIHVKEKDEIYGRSIGEGKREWG